MLPDGWEELVPLPAQRMIRVVEHCADHGGIGLLIREQRHEKGYALVTLPPHHPFAQGTDGGRKRGNRQQLLHRYLVMRRQGRRLPEELHVHHPEGVPKDSLDADRLQPMVAEQHDRYHHNQRQGCGAHIYDCPACVDSPREDCETCGGGGVVVETPTKGVAFR